MTLAEIDPGALYDAKVVADVFGLQVCSVYGMIARGILPCVRVGPNRRLVRVVGEDIIAYVAAERAA